jgi:lipoprotein-anchoring transpeptidase ErfK/SrfK
VAALLRAMAIATPDDMVDFLERIGGDGAKTLHVAIPAPALPPYYAANMDLKVEIDRGDVWYDFPWTPKGKPIVQRREHFPHLIVYAQWGKQKVPLVRWRTTIGSWRSEAQADGKVYYKYKNSDVGPRIWKNIVASPVWIPPDGTPAKDLLTRKIFDRNAGPVAVVNTDIMGPGFQSAYGLAMAIHLKKQPGGGLFDNQIRTHGSVDYTSIARRFSHGCHRLVNNRAVRLFDFVLRHRPYKRLGNNALAHFKRRFSVDGKDYEYELDTRGYYYELDPPVNVDVLEGRIMGEVKKPITAYVRKPGVDYGAAADGVVETAPVLGP